MKVGFRNLLLGDPQIAALATGGVDWKASAPGAEGGRIVLHQIGGAQGHVQKGPDGLEQARVQVDCLDETYGGADALAQAVIKGLDGYRAGPFKGIFRVATRDARESDGLRSYRISVDFVVHHRED